MQNKKIVVAPGVFDILHTGHIRLLKFAKNLGNVLVVSLLSDKVVKELKGKDPIISFKDRKEILMSLYVVDIVICQKQIDIELTLLELPFLPDILMRCEHNKCDHGLKFMKNVGGEVVRFPRTKGISSTQIKEKIVNSEGGDVI